MPDNDLYDDGEEATPAPRKSDKDAPETTALLPKSFFQGKDLDIGKQCKVEIVRLLDSEVEVRYVRHEDKDKEEDDSEDVVVEEEEDPMMV